MQQWHPFSIYLALTFYMLFVQIFVLMLRVPNSFVFGLVLDTLWWTYLSSSLFDGAVDKTSAAAVIPLKYFYFPSRRPQGILLFVHVRQRHHTPKVLAIHS